MNIVEATDAYEAWMARHTSIVQDDIEKKHKLIAKSPFVFLRGTFYRWVQIWPTICASLADAPTVLAVGDLHVENFGTWRDAEGRLVWGVNDLDEASPLPYTSDLVRLATSAVLATEEEHLSLSVRKICESILDGYAASLERGGRPFVLAERHEWLRQIAIHELTTNPTKFWKKIGDNDEASDVPKAVVDLLDMPDDSIELAFFRRQAGVGSLGRPRFVARAVQDGGFIAREAKAIVPPAGAWVAATQGFKSYSVELSRSAVRAPDPFFNANPRWTVRRLSPECLKIEVTDFPRSRDDGKLLRAMGWETANIHLGTKKTAVKKDLAGRTGRWLERATRDMVDATISEQREWRKHRRRARRSRGRKGDRRGQR
jgi:hypothetical protein